MTPLITSGAWLLIGVEVVDEEHLALAALLNGIAASAAEAERGSDAVLRLEELYRSARDHFSHEEALMAEIGFGDLASHRREHLMLLAELRAFIREVGDGRARLDGAALGELKHWLVAHIAGSDRLFADAWLRQLAEQE